MLEQGQCVRSSPCEKEGVTMCDKLTTTLIPRPPVPLRKGGGRDIRSEVEPRKKGGVGGRCFKLCFNFSLSYSDLIGDKLN